jgi:exopolysaccharide biosynthesis predicted pyruvyltransferase EpsI
MPPAGPRSSYFNETNVLGKAIDSNINQNPNIALAKRVEITRDLVFHPFLDTTPQAMATLACSKHN